MLLNTGISCDARISLCLAACERAPRRLRHGCEPNSGRFASRVGSCAERISTKKQEHQSAPVFLW